MPDFVEVARAADIAPGMAIRVVLNHLPIAIFNCDGQFFAIGDTCTHEEASLSEGELVEPCVVECPLHGAQFDVRTGQALCLPATGNAGSFEVRVEDGAIKVSATS